MLASHMATLDHFLPMTGVSTDALEPVPWILRNSAQFPIAPFVAFIHTFL